MFAPGLSAEVARVVSRLIVSFLESPERLPSLRALPLAEVEAPRFGAVGEWVIIAGFFLGSLYMLAKLVFWLYQLTRPRPEPSSAYVGKDLCKTIHAATNQRIAALEKTVAAQAVKQSNDISGVHGRCDEILAAVSELKGEMKGKD